MKRNLKNIPAVNDWLRKFSDYSLIEATEHVYFHDCKMDCSYIYNGEIDRISLVDFIEKYEKNNIVKVLDKILLEREGYNVRSVEWGFLLVNTQDKKEFIIRIQNNYNYEDILKQMLAKIPSSNSVMNVY